MGITTLFDIASSGITAQRLALEVSGENIANVNSAGYSRQEVIMTNRPVSMANGFLLGTGVEIHSVRRAYDEMLQRQIVSANSSYQQNLARQEALLQIQPSFNDLAMDGLGTALENFFGAWHDLSTNPAGSPERQALLSRAQGLVDTFHQMDRSLTTVAQTADNNLVGVTAGVTDNAMNLALVNHQILASRAVGGNPNELLDQRDLLIRKLSEKIAVTFTLSGDGTATVNLAGGEALVAGSKWATMYTTAGATSNAIRLSGLGNPPPSNNPAGDSDIGATMAGPDSGELGGLLQVRDGVAPRYQAKLDEIAAFLVSAVNAQHGAGYGLDGTTGSNFFAVGVTAGEIALDPALNASKIAAALPTAGDPAPTSSGNNRNALAMAALRDNISAFSSGAATFDNFYSSIIGEVGIATEGAQNLTAKGAAFLKQLNALRSSNAGVSLDEELINLTRYQRAFQGSAKVISAATDMLDIVLGLVR